MHGSPGPCGRAISSGMTHPWLTGDITSANSDRHRRAADDAVTGDASGQLEAFRALAAGTVASTNVEAFKVSGFDAAGELLDGRRLRIRLAGDDSAAGIAEFEAAQKTYLTARGAFEHLWVGGEEFVYFAVNAGGRGLPKFGDFCLVVPDPSERGRSVAVFPDDTAQRYGDKSPVDADRARDEAAAWEDRDALAVTQLGSRALTAAPPAWPELICSNDGYLETVVTPSPPIVDVAEVRLPQEYLDRLERLDAREVNGEDLTDTEWNELDAFRSIESWRALHGTVTVGIP
jgi:hypothetical protein